MVPAEHKDPWGGGLLTRRQMLQVGGISIRGLSLPGLLYAGHLHTPGRSGKVTEKSCIFVVQYGGGSHLDTLDPKSEPTASPAPRALVDRSSSGLVERDDRTGACRVDWLR
jgi:hypothetical protein